ncbi:helix-turn-helix domain-containing protein [Candidatus Galacturonibacter soehngenii]|nr:helix-turn-helix domain-containing protein [Candidatus Galacturonibacter soehngenii]
MILENIKIQCKIKKVSISKMERDLHFTRGYIHKWNRIVPGVNKVKMVSDYLGVTVEDLIKQFGNMSRT